MKGAGERNRLVVIERASDTPDGKGGTVREWVPLRQAWVNATPVAGKEALVAGTLRSEQPWRIEMLFTRDLTVKDRINMNGQPYTIQSLADPDGARRCLVLFCVTEQV